MKKQNQSAKPGAAKIPSPLSPPGAAGQIPASESFAFIESPGRPRSTSEVLTAIIRGMGRREAFDYLSRSCWYDTCTLADQLTCDAFDVSFDSFRKFLSALAEKFPFDKSRINALEKLAAAKTIGFEGVKSEIMILFATLRVSEPTLDEELAREYLDKLREYGKEGRAHPYGGKTKLTILGDLLALPKFANVKGRNNPASVKKRLSRLIVKTKQNRRS